MSRSVVIVDAVRTPFGKAGSLYAGTRADDLIVRAIRGLLERNPKVDPKTIDDVAVAAATQSGDQGMNIGRSAALLSGLPNSVPGYSIDRWCAGALTAVTTVAGSIAMGAYDVAIADGFTVGTFANFNDNYQSIAGAENATVGVNIGWTF